MLFNIILCLVIISNHSLSTLRIDIRNNTKTVDFRNNSRKDLCKTSNELCHVKLNQKILKFEVIKKYF